MKKALLVISLTTAFVLLTRKTAASSSTLETVPKVDLERYAGVWYEIARYPNSFQKGCVGTTATYTVRGEKLEVVNSCRNGWGGSKREVRGKAWPIDAGNARLKVSFFWPFRGDYWIIELGERYEYAVVGTPGRELLWILSRTPKMDPALYAGILEKIRRHGFEPERLIITPQEP